MTASETLAIRLAGCAAQGVTVPCQCRHGGRWTSDDATERAWAASVCTGLACPLLEPCALAADERAEKWGVWAGVDRSGTRRTRQVGP